MGNFQRFWKYVSFIMKLVNLILIFFLLCIIGGGFIFSINHQKQNSGIIYFIKQNFVFQKILFQVPLKKVHFYFKVVPQKFRFRHKGSTNKKSLKITDLEVWGFFHSIYEVPSWNCYQINYTYSVKRNKGLFKTELRLYMYATSFGFHKEWKHYL
jgi:hypothetical protein